MRNENKTSEPPEKIKFNVGDIVKLRHSDKTYIILSCVMGENGNYGYGLYNIHTGKTYKNVWTFVNVQKCIDRVVSVNPM